MTGRPLRDFAQHLDLDRHAFAARYPYPFLVSAGGLAGGAAPQAFQTMPGMPRWTDGVAAAPQVAYALQKSERNHFAGMITLGRADNNDVIIEDPSVSKFHAFFKVEPTGRRWSLHDAGSTYGTFAKGHRLDPDDAYLLTSGDAITFSGTTTLVFYAPEDLYDVLRLLRDTKRL